MTEIADLQVQLQLQAEQFKKGVAQANRSLDRMERNSRKTNTAVNKMQKGMAGLGRVAIGLAGTLGGMFTGAQVKAAIDYADALGKAAETLGFTTKELQEYRLAADLAGLNTSQLESNLTAFVKRVGEAKAGVGPLISGLKGMDAELLEGLKAANSQAEALQLVKDAMDGAATASDRARIANAAFSRAGVAMGRFFQSLDEAKTKAEELGLILSEDLTSASAILNDELAILTTQVGTKFKTAFIQAGIAVAEFFDIFTNEDAVAARVEEIEGVITNLVNQRSRFEQVFRNDPEALASNTSYLSILEQINFQEAKLLEVRGQIKKIKEVTGGPTPEEEAAAAEAERVAAALQAEADAAQEASDKLQKYAETLTLAANPAYAFEQAMIDINAALAAGFIDGDTYRSTVISVQEALFSVGTTAKDTAKSIEELALEIQSSVDPSIDFFAEMDVLNRVFEAGAINADTYRLKVLQLQEVFDNSDGITEQKGMWEELGESINFTIDLNKSFADNMKSIASSVISELLRIIATQKLLNLVMGSFGGGGGAPAATQAQGGAWINGVQAFAHGGVVGSPTFFGMAGGKTGLMGEAGPEAIMPLSRDASGDLGVKMNVNVHNHASGVAAVEVEQGDRNGEINVIINRIAQDIARGGGKVSGALERTYNVRR